MGEPVIWLWHMTSGEELFARKKQRINLHQGSKDKQPHRKIGKVYNTMATWRMKKFMNLTSNEE